jgi:hypothetical protein
VSEEPTQELEAQPAPAPERIVIERPPRPTHWHLERHGEYFTEEISLSFWAWRAAFLGAGLAVGFLAGLHWPH